MAATYGTFCATCAEIYNAHYFLEELKDPSTNRVRCAECGASGYFSRYRFDPARPRTINGGQKNG